MKDSFREIKIKCLKANLEILNNKLAIYTFGNVSIIDRDKNIMAIKPSGVPYQDLKPNDIVVLSLDGEKVEGDLNPSSDTKTHLYLYSQWKNISSICHTHSTYSVAWAQALNCVPIYGTTHADHLTSEIPCTEPMNDKLIKGDYEMNTGKQIIKHFNENKLNPSDIQMCLVGSHGPFTWGNDETESVYNSVVLEEICKMAYLTKSINPHTQKIKDSLIEKHYFRKHGKNSYYGQGK